jgi:hypothetical protein
MPVRRLPDSLASGLGALRMTVTPIPVRSVVPLIGFRPRSIFSAFLLIVLAVETGFVVVPIVVVLMRLVVYAAGAVIFSMMFPLSIILRRGGCTSSRGSGKRCG